MTRTVVRRSVSATTARNAPVSRPWKVRGRSRRKRRGRPMRRSETSSALGECVADTSDRQNESRRSGVVLDLVAQMAHVDVDGLLVLVERLVVAQQLEQLGARVDAAGAGGQVAEDLELGRCQADPPVSTLDASPFEVDEQVAVADDPPSDGVREVAIRAAQERLDPAHQLAQPERLGQVVVGAELEAYHL